MSGAVVMRFQHFMNSCIKRYKYFSVLLTEVTSIVTDLDRDKALAEDERMEERTGVFNPLLCCVLRRCEYWSHVYVLLYLQNRGGKKINKKFNGKNAARIFFPRTALNITKAQGVPVPLKLIMIRNNSTEEVKVNFAS